MTYLAESVKSEKSIIPGTYEGIWFGYTLTIEFHNGNKSQPIKLDQGIRGTSRVTVIVNEEGKVFVSEHK